MKKDIDGKPTRGTMRTLGAFRNAMLELLSEKPLASISVNALCERSSYPRATFYNYFEDRDDLLRYCWRTFAREADLDDLESVDPRARMDRSLDALADLLERHDDLLRDVIAHNPVDGPLFASLRAYIVAKSRAVMRTCAHREQGLPAELISDHYANTLMLVLDWSYLRGHRLPREELHAALHGLLRDTEG